MIAVTAADLKVGDSVNYMGMQMIVKTIDVAKSYVMAQKVGETGRWAARAHIAFDQTVERTSS